MKGGGDAMSAYDVLRSFRGFESMMNDLHRTAALCALLGVVCLTGCDEPREIPSDELEGAYLFGSLSEEVRAALPIIGVKEISGFGAYPGDMSFDGSYAYIVDYSNNCIHRMESSKYAVDENFIDLGQNAGPYSVYADANGVWTTLQGVVQVLRFDRQGKQKTLVLSNEHIKAPTDLVYYKGYTIIADSEYDYSDSSKTAGSIIAVSEEGKLVRRKTSAQNPTFVRVLEYGGEAYIVALDAGVATYAADFSVDKLPEKSCLDVWKFSDFVHTDEDHSPKSVCVENASLGAMTWTGEEFYVGNAMQPRYHAIAMSELFDMTAQKSELTTHELSSPDYTTIIRPIAVDGALFLFDSAKNTVIWKKGSASHSFALTDEDTVKMPIDVEYDSKNRRLFVLNSASGSVDVFDVR